MTMIKNYTELSRLSSFEERYHYLQLKGSIGKETFGFDRFINQNFYRSREWKLVRDFVIVRDNGCDLGIDGREIRSKILIHHMNPIFENDIINRSDFLLNPEYLITTFLLTHNAIHFGDETLLITNTIDRCKNDTCPWRK